MRQLPLALPFAPALGRGDFIPADSNRAAVAALDRWPDWPRPGLLLWGPEACGKSHLVEIWRQQTDARLLHASALAAPDPLALAEGMTPVAVEDLGAPLVPEAELALFRLYNLVLERRGSLLLTSRIPPASWPVALADLRSRLNAMPAISIGAPEDALIDRLLAKLFADRQVSVDPETLAFARARMERSCAAARRLVDAIDQAALAQKRPITVPLVRAVLEELWPKPV